MSARWFIVIITQDGKELPSILNSLALLRRKPAAVSISVDGCLPNLGGILSVFHEETGIPTRAVERPFSGIGRRSQTRNNGVRALMPSLMPDDWISFLDGDIAVGAGHFSQFAPPRDADVLLSYVWRLDPSRSNQLREALASERDGFAPTACENMQLIRHAIKLETQLVLRRLFGLVPKWWPSLGAGNFAVRFSAFGAVNGFDEDMVGWGVEDADLGQRLYASGARVKCAVLSRAAFHLWHPPAKPFIGRTEAGSNGIELLRDGRPRYARWGLSSPRQQGPCDLEMISLGKLVAGNEWRQ